jgi:putative intracellular protease/amidase
MTQPTDVHLFLPQTMADWEPGYAVAHINRPAPGMPSAYRVRTVGLSKAPVRTVGGLTLLPDLTVAELDPRTSALLILPGADNWDGSDNDPILDRARAFVQQGKPVAAICGATLGLARAGLLDECRHTSNALEFLAASGYAGASRYVDEPAVEDGGIITANSTAPLEFARLILARLKVYPDDALREWYGLFKTSKPEHYFGLVAALEKHAEQAGP